MTTKLKPCPFCGGKAKLEVTIANYCSIFCNKCYAEIDLYRTEKTAIKRWNTRAKPQSNSEVRNGVTR